MIYLTKLDQYISIVLILYLFCEKSFLLMWENGKKGRGIANKQINALRHMHSVKQIWKCTYFLMHIGVVAERISYFCLARNLIQPLGSTHNFTQSGWLIQFNPDHLSGKQKLGKQSNTFSFSELLSSGQTSYCLLFNSSSSSITPPWGKLSNLWTLCVYSLRPRVPSWIWMRWIQYATHRNNFMSPPKLAMSITVQNSTLTPSYFTSGQHFLEKFTLLP